MDKLDLIFEKLVLSTNKILYVIYAASMEHLKICEKSDVIAVFIATVTFQYKTWVSPNSFSSIGINITGLPARLQKALSKQGRTLGRV